MQRNLSKAMEKPSSESDSLLSRATDSSTNKKLQSKPEEQKKHLKIRGPFN